jgi:hypothetical protein
LKYLLRLCLLLKFTKYQQKAVEEGHSEQSPMSMSTASYMQPVMVVAPFLALKVFVWTSVYSIHCSVLWQE